ncbi:uncharacterized protein VTP21DRAFT_11102 [Calcarisporiella thermophila]|uniref:uncharacterized protein n=1 Tax=Calcarisporiella thermophila TaxID=911321 RepID=UPI003743FF8B
MFCDLNILYSTSKGAPSDDVQQSVKLASHLGYDVVALNYAMTGKVPTSGGNANPVKKVDTANYERSIRQLTRLTVTVEESNHNYGLTSTNALAQSYDLLAVKPTTEKGFQHACSTLEIDIITLDLSTRLPFYLKHTTVGQAIDRGIYFEIGYGGAIRDNSARRHLISNAQALVRVTHGKNLILSSEAQRALELRGPYDVINLGALFGLNQATAKDCVAANGRAVILRAETRRNTYRAVVGAAPLKDLKPEEEWKLGKGAPTEKRNGKRKAEDDLARMEGGKEDRREEAKDEMDQS